MKYRATERGWVMRLLARLTPAQRARYEAEMAKRPGDYRTGKKYDRLKVFDPRPVPDLGMRATARKAMLSAFLATAGEGK